LDHPPAEQERSDGRNPDYPVVFFKAQHRKCHTGQNEERAKYKCTDALNH
jgi:hypothetical protein